MRALAKDMGEVILRSGMAGSLASESTDHGLGPDGRYRAKGLTTVSALLLLRRGTSDMPEYMIMGTRADGLS
jgi:hypothetical protein